MLSSDDNQQLNNNDQVYEKRFIFRDAIRSKW
jgi:hypothetical protein